MEGARYRYIVSRSTTTAAVITETTGIFIVVLIDMEAT